MVAEFREFINRGNFVDLLIVVALFLLVKAYNRDSLVATGVPAGSMDPSRDPGPATPDGSDPA